MRVLRARNVNGLFYEGMHLLDECGERGDSRAGPVVVAPWPVMSVYEQPCERVLFDERRDANSFFHLMEGLWMLAGRQDSKFLDRYVKDFGSRYAEPDGTIHDAYGHRWRSAFGFDQLDHVVKMLRDDPTSRQAVVAMWDPSETRDDFENCNIMWGMDDLQGVWRGRPCNTHCYFRVRERVATLDEAGQLVLDMTICCRSNDMVWGGYGANAVHFSVLLEYLAGRIGIGVGTMYQLSNNCHAYTTELERIGDPTQLAGRDPYEDGEVHSVAMAHDWFEFDNDLHFFMNWHDAWDFPDGIEPKFTNNWFRETAMRVALARWQWTHGQKHAACLTAEQITAPDWQTACLQWMNRRAK